MIAHDDGRLQEKLRFSSKDKYICGTAQKEAKDKKQRLK